MKDKDKTPEDLMNELVAEFNEAYADRFGHTQGPFTTTVAERVKKNPLIKP
jgi:hypothetical protein